MLKKRIIPLLLIKDDWLVRSETFSKHQRVGKPVHQVNRYRKWFLDELIVLDISKAHDEHRFLTHMETSMNALGFPLTVGGHIKSLEQIEQRIRCGAEKVVINTHAHQSLAFIQEAAHHFGRQAIVVCTDVKKRITDYQIVTHHATSESDWEVDEWLHAIEEAGAGEHMIQFVDYDGMKTGYDISFIQKVSNHVSIPLLVCGGVGEEAHVNELFTQTGAHGAVVGNMFLFKELSYFQLKSHLHSLDSIREAII